jgi:AmmeMemoRadiSam system protein A
MTTDLSLTTFRSLTSAERRELLRLARASIRAALDGDEPPMVYAMTATLAAPAAAFVSLHCERRLRGCIGTLLAENPLHKAVSQAAVSAAFEDPRFPPLAAHELPSVDIEISRLSPLVPASPENVRPGIHGVSVKCGERRAVFLPQVAVEHDWDRETLLSELCRKALLAPDAWRQMDTALMVFEAEVFNEHAGA